MNNHQQKEAVNDLLSEIESLKNRIRILQALRFTEPVYPDVCIPNEQTELSKGWFFDSYIPRAERACSSKTSHSIGYDDRTTSHGAICLFSTEVLAWKACRNQMETRFAVTLARVDERIRKLEGQ